MDGRDDVDAKAPVLAGLEPHAVVDRRALGVGLAALGEEHLRDALEVAGIGEDELALLRVVGRGDGRRKGLGVLGIAERVVVFLHREDVGEVVSQLEGDVELDLAPRVVADVYVLLHPLADEASACDRELVRMEPSRRWVAQVERGRVVLDLALREQQRPVAVHGQDPVREEASVAREEAHGGAVDVAVLVRDAERRALEDRDRHAV